MVVAKRKPWRVTDKAVAWHGASELSKVNFQTDKSKEKVYGQYFEVLLAKRTGN